MVFPNTGITYAVPIQQLKKTKYTHKLKKKSPRTSPSIYAHTDVAQNKGLYSPERPCTTLYDAFYNGWKRAKAIGDVRLLGQREKGKGPYKWIEYQGVEIICTAIASRLGSLGLNKGDIVGLYSRTRSEWLQVFMGCQFRSLIVVPLYDTLGDDSIVYIMRQTQCRVVVVSQILEARKLVSLCCDGLKVEHIVVIDWPSTEDDNEQTLNDWNNFISEIKEKNNITCESFDQFKAYGVEHPLPHEPPIPGDIFEICYTSGTTGTPKGAVYNHDRMITECMALMKYIKDHMNDSRFEVMLCYLPLAHSYELCVELLCIMSGYKLGYFCGDVRRIIDDVQCLQPTILTAVPRVLTRIHDGIMKKASRQEAGVLRSLLFRLALRRKINEQTGPVNTSSFRKSIMHRESMIDKLFFKRLRQLLGGKMKLMFVGSAVTPPKTLRMLRATLGFSVCEGYGLTETYGITLIQVPGDWSTRCIGGPVACVHVKVVDVPELGYLAINNEGELCVKGHSTIAEYYKNPSETAKTIDSEGWVHTGDVAKINPNGSVSIIDRVKEFFKLAQGEYVIPAKVEGVYKECGVIENIVICGSPFKNCCVAIVFPNNEELASALKQARINVDQSNYRKSKTVKDYLMKIMEQQATKSGLKGFEKVKNIYISNVPLSDLSNLITPTMKVRRHNFVKHFEAEIAQMYESL